MTKQFPLSTTLEFPNPSPHLMSTKFKVSLSSSLCGLVVGVLAHAPKAHGFMSPLRSWTRVAGSILCVGCNQLMCLFHNDVFHSLSLSSSLPLILSRRQWKKIFLCEDQQLKNKNNSILKYKVYTWGNSQAMFPFQGKIVFTLLHIITIPVCIVVQSHSSS